MSIISEKQEELEGIRMVRFITRTLRDISAMNIRELRVQFTQNAAFYREVRDLYQLIKQYARAHGYTKDIEEGTERVLSVAVTSNKRFYGSLNADVMDAFIGRMKGGKQNEDHMVIGKTGEQYLSNTSLKETFTFMHFIEDDPSEKEVGTFLDRVANYDRVFLFYPHFESIFKQEPTAVDITYTPEEEIDEPERIGYIFEPELPELLDFFETRIRHLLFDRIMLETTLSRTAARLIKMNGAEQRASEMIEEKQRTLQKEAALLENMQLLETFSGITQWKKR